MSSLLVLALLAAAVLASAGRVELAAHASVAKPFCLVDTHIPDEAYVVEAFARTHNYSPPPGLKGGSSYRDDSRALPPLLRPYTEYDVYPARPGEGRPSPRVVLSTEAPYASWYTPDHYGSFLLMFPLSCVPNVTSLLPRNLFGGGGE